MQRAIQPRWLLRQADELGYRLRGAGQPRNSDLRRSVSSAYCALFHGIAWAMADHLLPDGPLEHRAGLTRSVSHEAIGDVCRWVIGKGGAPRHAFPLVESIRRDPAMVDVADGFLDLKEQRHAADYDHLADFSKAGVLNLVDTARSAIDNLDRLQLNGSEALRQFLVLTSLKTGIR